MEAQPIALVVAMLMLLTTGTIATAPIGAGGITLVALGLLWWAMIVEHIVRRSARGRRMGWLHFIGWLAALAATAGPSLPSLLKGEHIFPWLVGVVLVTWLWRRAMQRAQAGFEYGQLATSFKVGFGVLLGMLLLVIMLPELPALSDELGSSLPIFFLSGLIVLSLARLGAIRSTHRSLDGSQADPTRAWLLALTIFAVTLLAVVIAIEAIFSFSSFELVVKALAPLWNALGTLVGWLLSGFIIVVLSPIFDLVAFLFGLITQHGAAKQKPQSIGPKPSPIHQPWSAQTIPPELLVIGRWVFLALVTSIVLLVVQASLRRWFLRSDGEGVEEVREGLDARSLLGQHWRDWWNRWRRKVQAVPALELLDPASARARYRELLQAIAEAKGDLARNPAETPAEYEVRLLTHLESGAQPLQALAQIDTVPQDAAMLEELTRTYSRERYGGKLTDEHTRADLRRWVPRLVMRLTGRASTSAAGFRDRS
jgi:hypothetical protein